MVVSNRILGYSNLVREWNDKYERLTSMVVPRSSSYVTSSD